MHITLGSKSFHHIEELQKCDRCRSDIHLYAGDEVFVGDMSEIESEILRITCPVCENEINLSRPPMVEDDDPFREGETPSLVYRA